MAEDERAGLSREELLELVRRQQEALAERAAAIKRRDAKIRELEEELAQFRRPAWPFVITTHEDDAFGRYLAVVWRTCDEACLNDLLLQTGHAVPFTT